MAQRHANLAPFVLEDEHILHLWARAEFGIAVAPHINQLLDAFYRQSRERGVVVRGIQHHFAGAVGGHHGRERRRRDGRRRRLAPQRREAVLEHHDFIGRFGHFRWVAAWLRGAQRAVFGRWMEGALLAVRRRDDPLLQQRMPAQLGHARMRIPDAQTMRRGRDSPVAAGAAYCSRSARQACSTPPAWDS
jgi:hypothetical protein